MNATETVVPVVGMGVTYCIGSDRYPYEVVKVVNDRTLQLREMDFRRTDNNGMSESQTYDITPNPARSSITVTLRKNGRWCQKGQPMNSGGYSLGHARAYQDPSF